MTFGVWCVRKTTLGRCSVGWFRATPRARETSRKLRKLPQTLRGLRPSCRASHSCPRLARGGSLWCSAFVLNHSFDALQSKYIASIAILRRQRSTFASTTTATAAIGTENARNMTNAGRLPSLHLTPARHYDLRSSSPSLPIPISSEDARASENFASTASLHARASDAALRDYL